LEQVKDGEVLTALVAALTHAFDNGSPVAGQSPERRREIADPIVPTTERVNRRSIPLHARPRKGACGLSASRVELGSASHDGSELLDAYQAIGGS
jgi:hypothetical protein